MRGEHSLFRDLEDHGHKLQQFDENVGSNEVHHLVCLGHIRAQKLGMRAVLGIVNEDVVVV